jgi:hypothetical protein
MIQQQQLFESAPLNRKREVVSRRPQGLQVVPGHCDHTRLPRRLMLIAAALLDFPALAARHRMSQLIDVIFVAQDRFQDRASLYSWLLIGAGQCRWVTGHRGGVLQIAQPLDMAADRSQVIALERAINRLVFQTPETARQIWPSYSGNEHAQVLCEIKRRVGRRT